MQTSGPISHMILSLRSNMLSIAYSSPQSKRADFDSPPLQFYAPESRQCLAHASRATIANVKCQLTVAWTRITRCKVERPSPVVLGVMRRCRHDRRFLLPGAIAG